MATINQIKAILEEADTMKIIAETLTMASATKLKRVREGILRNRSFLGQLTNIFYLVRATASQKKIPIIVRPKKLACLLLTSNHRFYGNLETNLIRYFMVNTTKIAADRFVVGKIAFDYLNSIHYFHSFKSFIFPDDIPTPIELKQLMSLLTNYQQTIVFYSQLRSIAIQEPKAIDITQFSPDSANTAKIIPHIFEPELVDILQFFENQIITLLLEQTFLESELARAASRLLAMDQSQGSADLFITQQIAALADIKRTISNTHLLETIGNLSIWKKELSHDKH